MNAPTDVSYDDYMGEALKDPLEAAAYLEAVMDLEDPAALLVALRHVAKAHDMAEVARRRASPERGAGAGLSIKSASSPLKICVTSYQKDSD
jgi:hypothetical protein